MGPVSILEAVEVINRETSRLEESTLDQARGRTLMVREMEGELRIQMAPLMERVTREQDQLRPQDLEELPVFDPSDQDDWIEDVEGMVRIRSLGGRHRICTGNLEPPLQNDLLVKILERTNGDSWLAEHLGIQGSTPRHWRTKHIADPC
jgi:hypothetical protein